VSRRKRNKHRWRGWVFGPEKKNCGGAKRVGEGGVFLLKSKVESTNKIHRGPHFSFIAYIVDVEKRVGNKGYRLAGNQ